MASTHVAANAPTRWRRQLLRRWHALVFKRRHGPLDWVRRTGWYLRTSPSYGVIAFVTLVSVATTVASLVASSRLWLVVGLVSLLMAVAAFVVDWRSKSREAAALYAVAIQPTDYTYDAPYVDWPEIRLPGDTPGLHYHPDLDEQLRREEPLVTFSRSGVWTPSGPAHEVWRRWGGRRGQFIERKIRLGTDLLPGATSVEVQKTDYVSYIVTNGLADKVIRDRTGSLAELTFVEVGLRLDVIPPLRRSGCSNHIGGDLLLVGDGTLWLHQQNHRNLVQPGALSLSASGSFDWDLDLMGTDDLITAVKNGVLRELEEELNLPRLAVPSHDDVRIVRYGRATYTGGKPQFFAIGRFRGDRLPVGRGRGDDYTEDILPVAFDVSKGLAGVVAALEESSRTYREVSRPYRIMVETLRDMDRRDDPLGRWLLFARDKID